MDPQGGVDDLAGTHPCSCVPRDPVTKRRDRKPKPSAAPPPAPVPAALPPLLDTWRIRAIDVAAIAVALLCAGLGWASRGTLNVDGVSYLDLAAAVARGDWSALVQGYWSPLYPALLAPLVLITAGDRVALITAAHLLNAVIAIALVAMLWRIVRRRGDVAIAWFTFTAFLVASARTPRLDAVTPDLLLLLAVAGFGCELLRTEGWRGGRLGLWAGFAFLAKTSAWPWLVVIAAISGVAIWRDPTRRVAWLRAVAVATVPLVLWSMLLSIKTGRPALGDAGRFNACWYLFRCDGRSPDTHRGEHLAYQTWPIGDSLTVRIASFDDPRWTYQPWSDVSAWQDGITVQARTPTLDIPAYLHFVLRQFGYVVGLWMRAALLLVWMPLLVTRRGGWAGMGTIRSPAAMAMLAGLIGILQFTAVHAEPRLIAPFVLLATLGLLHWRGDAAPRRWEWPLALIGLVIALVVGAAHLFQRSDYSEAAAERHAKIQSELPSGVDGQKVVIVGTAFPLVPEMYRFGARAAAQVFVPGPEDVLHWPVEIQRELILRLRSLGATTVWFSRGKEGYRVVSLVE